MNTTKSFLITLIAAIWLAACELTSNPSSMPSPISSLSPKMTGSPPPTPTSLPQLSHQTPQRVIDFVHGMNLGHQGDDIYFLDNLAQELDTLASFHVDTVRLDLTWFMEKPGSFEIRSVSGSGSLSDYGFRFFAQTVNEKGMDSWLTLTLQYDDWKGAFDWHEDDEWEEWERNYTNYVLYYANLAESNGVDYFSIVNERLAFISREKFMVELIRKVRNVYSGKIAINIGACPEDDYKQIPAAIVKESDIIGLNLYPSPQTPSGATIEEMADKLVTYFNRVADHFSGLEYNSLVISEFGVSRLDGSTMMQCTWMTPDTNQEDLKEMADYYQAFARALEQSRLGSMVDGVILHQWRINETVVQDDFLKLNIDNDMNPRGNQLAIDAITNWFSTLGASP